MTSVCPHMFAMKQASVTIDGTRHCAVCAVETVEDMLPISTPGRIAHVLEFDDRASRIGVTGALLLLWSYLKMQDDTEQRHVGNRLGRVLDELGRIHGPLFYLGDKKRELPSA